MAEHTVAAPSCPSALQESECNTKDVSSCHILSNNNDRFSGKEQDVPIDFQRSETCGTGSMQRMQCNGKPHSHHQTMVTSPEADSNTPKKALFDTTSEGKKLNGLIHNEHNYDNGIVKNVVLVVKEDTESSSKQTQKVNLIEKCYQNCDAGFKDNETHCISEQTRTPDNEVDVLSKKLEDVSVVSSSNTCVSSDGENQSATESKKNIDHGHSIEYVVYESERQMPDIMRLITKDLSEPYSIYTYRYFIHNWPRLCFLAKADDQCVGAIVCKLDMHKKMARRGYIAMLAVDSEYRRRQIGSTLVTKAIEAMIKDDCDEVVLETEITNQGALHLYENLGFVRDKRLFRYYLNGVDALRLKLWLR